MYVFSTARHLKADKESWAPPASIFCFSPGSLKAVPGSVPRLTKRVKNKGSTEVRW
jgi:hypothetical protein